MALMANQGWEEALRSLYEMGWDADQIEGASEVLAAACLDGPFEGEEIADLADHQIEHLLGDELTEEEAEALRVVAALNDTSDPESDALRGALWDLDDFLASSGRNLEIGLAPSPASKTRSSAR